MFSMDDLRAGAALRPAAPAARTGAAGARRGNKLLLGQYMRAGAARRLPERRRRSAPASRFFTSAFETAWAPFYYATSRAARREGGVRQDDDLRRGGAGAARRRHDGRRARRRSWSMLKPEYLGAAPVVPLIAVGIALQGVYLLTSIGLNLTSRTEFYPVVDVHGGRRSDLRLGLVADAALRRRRRRADGAPVLRSRKPSSRSCSRSARIRSSTRSDACSRLVVAGAAAALAALWLVPALPPVAGLIARGLT